jgi:hypothetical protein
MGTKVYDNALDLITFSRNSGGTSLRKISYGDELVTNGTFDTDSDWVKGGSWVISGGEASCTGVGNNLSPSESIIEAGKLYKLTVDVVTGSITGFYTGISPTFTTTYWGGSFVAPSSGSYEFYYLATTNGYLTIRANEATVDNISVKEVLFDQPDGTLQLFYHPADIPRIDYSPDGTAKGLLIEEQRTNLVTYSEEFDSAAWIKSRATISPDSLATVDPNGTNNADLIIPDSGASGWSGVNFPSTAVTSGVTYTGSIYAKAGGYSWLQIGGSSPRFIGTFVNVNLANGSTGNGDISATVSPVGDGWYRISISDDAASTTTGSAFFIAVYDSDVSTRLPDSPGDGTSGIYLWGAQVEAGAFPTSYIPTSGSTVTRAADVASIPVSAFGYNQSAGTVVVEFETNNTADVNVLRLGTQSSYDNGLDLSVSSGSLSGIVWHNNTAQATYSGSSVSLSTTYKMAATVKPNDVQFAEDGSTSSVDTSVSIEPAVTLLIGDKDQTDLFGAVNVKSIQYFPRRLTNAQLQELTT